jgi:hypothetical protein
MILMNSQTLTISNFADLMDFARGLDLPEMRKMVLSLEEILEDKREADWEANREAYAAQANFNLCEDAAHELGLKHLRLADWSILEMLGLDQLEGPEYWDITALEAPVGFFIDQSIFLRQGNQAFAVPVLTTIGETLKNLDAVIGKIAEENTVWLLEEITKMTPEAAARLEEIWQMRFDLDEGSFADDLLANHSVLNADEYYEQQKEKFAEIDGRPF